MLDKVSRWLKKEVPAKMTRKQAILVTVATFGVFIGFLAFIDWLSSRR